MASRYLRATGNWNGAVWAATSDGVAGSAATPTVSDSVHIESNFSVTLTSNAVCEAITMFGTGAVLNLNGYRLDTHKTASFLQGTLSLSGGTITFSRIPASTFAVDFSAEYGFSVIDTEGSLIRLNAGGSGYSTFNTGGFTFADCEISIDDSSSVNITGSPTFRLLDIRSANSAAHTVNFDDDVYVSKLIAIGSSSGNKLTINNDNSKCFVFGESNTATTYGQFVNMAMQAVSNIFYDDPVNPTYIGSNSITNTTGWLLQDPPKISTLVDPLTTAPASNTNWTVDTSIGGSVPIIETVSTGMGGGGYRFRMEPY